MKYTASRWGILDISGVFLWSGHAWGIWVTHGVFDVFLGYSTTVIVVDAMDDVRVLTSAARVAISDACDDDA